MPTAILLVTPAAPQMLLAHTHSWQEDTEDFGGLHPAAASSPLLLRPLSAISWRCSFQPCSPSLSTLNSLHKRLCSRLDNAPTSFKTVITGCFLSAMKYLLAVGTEN